MNPTIATFTFLSEYTNLIIWLVVLCFGAWRAFCHFDVKHKHRSIPQWLILAFALIALRIFALFRAADQAYLTYRDTIRNTPLELANEMTFGKLLGTAEEPALQAVETD